MGATSAWRALAAQLSGLVLAVGLVWELRLPGPFYLLGFQAAIAAVVSYVLGQPRWWLPIHLLFVPAAYGLLQLGLPSWFYLAGLVGMLLVFWGTVRGDVPLYLSSPAVAQAIVAIVKREGARRFADLGAGIGSVAVPLARHMSGLEVDAWERAPLPWLLLRWRSRKLTNVRAVLRSFWDGDLARYDVVFAFLSPYPMPALGDKVRHEMRPGALFISSSFPVPDWEPEQVIQLSDARRTTLYCYRT
ncbi:MAG: class I SAM-dependent methyltransferase [Methylophilaceae bacterium]|nr:class I SAM-dependent methyltransferase [Methylophilaceae bacterium]